MSNKVFQSKSARFFLVRTGVIVFFLVLVSRLVYVQGVMRTELQRKADRQVPSGQKIKHIRNTIYDRNMLPLAETLQVYSCFVDPTKLLDIKKTAKHLGELTGLNASALEKKIRRTKGSFLWVKRNVPAPVVTRIRSRKIPGVGFKLEYRRHYPLGPIASHLLGMVGIDGHGLSGIEQRYDDRLMGKTKRGEGNIQLNLDGWIQQIVERELDWAVKKTRAKRGAVLVQDPMTGGIVAMAHWPPLSLDPDFPPHPEELRIPTFSDVFEPGSTFKVVIAAASLEENLVNEKEWFDGEKGAWKVGGIKIHDHEPRKRMRFDDIFIYSSNIGTAKLGNRVGAERLYQYARSFGFGVYPGSGLPGEAKGVLRTPRNWSGISKNVVSFGQEVGVTAIQLTGAYSAIANGGTLMEPQVVKGVVSDSGEYSWQNQPSPVRRAISEKTSQKLRILLTSVVDKGTGRNAKIRWNQDFPIAGKTGTAQKFDKANNRYSNDMTLVSFCGFFPSDAPKLTMLVILDEPEGRRWGGVDAAPVFRRIAEQVASDILL